MTTHGRDSAERHAPAKVNLCLAVDRPREDAMHPIASWMAPIDLCDTIEIHRRPAGRASLYNIDWAEDAPRTTPIDWSVSRDLAVRAHLALERAIGSPLPVRMRVMKRIPVGAGLGGGSSDAAAALAALRDMFKLDLSDERLAELAHGLSSDAPFFLAGGAAVVSGLGDRVERTPAPTLAGRPAAALLAVPETSCPTGAVYRAFDEARGERAFRDVEAMRMARAGAIETGALFNDLAESAMRLAPAVRAALEALAGALDRPAHVTGSGSGVFVVCDAEEADDLLQRAGRIEGATLVAARMR